MFLHCHCDLEGCGNLFLYEIASSSRQGGTPRNDGLYSISLPVEGEVISFPDDSPP
jgi:hypothetical protein